MRKLSIIIIFLVCQLALSVFAADNEVTTEKVVEQTAFKTVRPSDDNEPTKVKFFIYVIDIDTIDAVAQSFTANIFVRLNWQDKRLAHETGTLAMSLEEIWNPKLLLVNRGGIVQTSLPEVVEIEPDGTVTYVQRFYGPLSEPLRLADFPFDKNRFTIQFVATRYFTHEVEFEASAGTGDPNVIGGAISEILSLPDWKITKYVAEARPYVAGKYAESSGFVFEFFAKRHSTYYVWQVIVPLILIVMMSWWPFYIDPKNTGAQIGVATSSMLTLIAYRFMLGNLIPHLPYMTRLDYFTLGSTILVFSTLLEVGITTNLALTERLKTARRIDDCCRFIFPAGFIAWAVWSLIL